MEDSGGVDGVGTLSLCVRAEWFRRPAMSFPSLPKAKSVLYPHTDGHRLDPFYVFVWVPYQGRLLPRYCMISHVVVRPLSVTPLSPLEAFI